MHEAFGIRNSLFFHAVGQVEQIAGSHLINGAVYSIPGISLDNIGKIIIINVMSSQPLFLRAFSENMVKYFRHKIFKGRFFHKFPKKTIKYIKFITNLYLIIYFIHFNPVWSMVFINI
jgi:hypothetical protein